MCDPENDTTTQADPGRCCGSETPETDPNRDTDYWIDEVDVLDAQLPEELRSALGRFVGTESIDTLGEWTTEIRRLTGGGAIDVDQLCHTDTETEHWGDAGDERYYFQCFYDAAILAAVEERPVDIHTVSPGGTVVEARAVGSDELSVTPEEAVEIGKAFAAAGADLIDVSAGQTSTKARPVYGRMFQTPFSDRIRNEAKLATMAVGNIFEADHVNSILASGRADLCALARPHLSDPYWSLRAAAELGCREVEAPKPYLTGFAQLERNLAKQAAEAAALRA